MKIKRDKTKKARLMNRRDLMKDALMLTSLSLGLSAVSYFGYSKDPVRKEEEKIYQLRKFNVDSSLYPKVVIVRGSDPFMMLKAGLDRIGKITRYISPGDNVLVKPNVAWDRLPEQAANTNPLLVAAMVKILLTDAKANSVTVTDISLNDPARSFQRSGIKDATEKAGGKLLIPSSSDFYMTDLKGTVLNNWQVPKVYHKADKIINLPIVKQHSLSKGTMAMKNWYGAISGRRNRLHQNIDQSIYDLASAFRPTLTILDATRVLMRNGPTGGSLDDVKIENAIAIGFDEVALDSFGFGLIGVDPLTVGYIDLAIKGNLGVGDYKAVAYDEIKV